MDDHFSISDLGSRIAVRHKPLAYLIAGAFLTVCGCGPGNGKEFPLSVGRTWALMVDSPLENSHVEEVKVLRKVPVGDVEGYELGGQMGQSRIAWKDGILMAQQLPNATFNPPIPLLIGGADKATKNWKGMIGAAGRGASATATLSQEPSQEKFNGQMVNTTKATLAIHGTNPDLKIELITWYEKGEGPIHQEQRNNGILEVRSEAIVP
jgi:hypothetical protein